MLDGGKKELTKQMLDGHLPTNITTNGVGQLAKQMAISIPCLDEFANSAQPECSLQFPANSWAGALQIVSNHVINPVTEIPAHQAADR